MADATDEFFDQLQHRGYDRRLAIHNGSVRFDISADGRTDHWLVSLQYGKVGVSEGGTGGDAVVQADRAVFNRIASGEAYFLAVVLRGEAMVEGSPRLFALIRRLFPPPPDVRGESADAGGGAHG